MELITLDGNFQPSKLIERYGSLIWTERYSTAGDFQLVTTDVERMLKLLPLETVVSIRESTVPMLVEVHQIKKTKNSAPVLTVKGRSFETVLERRASAKVDPLVPTGPRIPWIEARAKSSDAAYQAIRQILGDVARPPLAAQTPILSPNDAIPEIDLVLPADYENAPATTVNYEIKPGNLYTVAMELMAANHRALKAVRPSQGNNKIAIEIYNGADLTNEVVFNAQYDQFEDSTYLLSYAGSNNWAYVFRKSGNKTVSKTASPEPTGLQRRVLYVDVSGEEGTDSDEASNTRGLVELYKYNATALFDGLIAEQVASGYNRDYFLGDIIRLDGEYGLSEYVRVAEFIRSDDSTGSKSYPTFEVVT